MVEDFRVCSVLSIRSSLALRACSGSENKAAALDEAKAGCDTHSSLRANTYAHIHGQARVCGSGRHRFSQEDFESLQTCSAHVCVAANINKAVGAEQTISSRTAGPHFQAPSTDIDPRR
eukprot:4093213-Amphidinium_carterae.1